MKEAHKWMTGQYLLLGNFFKNINKIKYQI